MAWKEVDPLKLGELAKAPLRWDITPQEIVAMDESQRLQFLIEVNERLRRVHDVLMHQAEYGSVSAPADAMETLHPFSDEEERIMFDNPEQYFGNG